MSEPNLAARLVGVMAAAAVVCAPSAVAGQASTPGAGGKPSSIPRTQDGKPDLQGTWDFRTITPMERPKDLADKPTLTAAEAAEWERKNQRNQDNREATPGNLVNGQQSNADVERAYNDFWWDFGKKAVSTRRTSLVIDPPDGRIPALTADGQKRAAARREARERPAVGPEDRGVGERCILGLNAGPPMTPSAYNNNVQLIQTPQHVVIFNEMVHNARVVPVSARPHGTVPQWNGDSRGRWEGDTFVVESKTFYAETSFQNSGDTLHLTERFTLADANTLIYEYTVNDPKIWTKPWTVQVPMHRTHELMYEYACHEHNYGMENLLKGARFLEKEGMATTKTSSR